ncbi:MAG: hypothetical protein R2726_05665 [Acidimicrobiales bacterium]
MTFDVSNLSSQDAIVALRSYPRRYSSVLSPLPGDDDTVDTIAQRVGPDGVCALDLLTDVVRTLAVIGRALHQTVYSDRPVLHEAVIDPAARHWEGPVETVADLLAQLRDEATELADAADAVPYRDWDRQATVTGGRTVTALDLLREAVRTATDDLHAIEQALRAARG